MTKIGNNNKIKNSVIGNNNKVEGKKDNHLMAILVSVIAGLIVAGIANYIGWSN